MDPSVRSRVGAIHELPLPCILMAICSPMSFQSLYSSTSLWQLLLTTANKNSCRFDRSFYIFQLTHLDSVAAKQSISRYHSRTTLVHSHDPILSRNQPPQRVRVLRATSDRQRRRILRRSENKPTTPEEKRS
jgi:hypothetical protein